MCKGSSGWSSPSRPTYLSRLEETARLPVFVHLTVTGELRDMHALSESQTARGIIAQKLATTAASTQPSGLARRAGSHAEQGRVKLQPCIESRGAKTPCRGWNSRQTESGRLEFCFQVFFYLSLCKLVYLSTASLVNSRFPQLEYRQRRGHQPRPRWTTKQRDRHHQCLRPVDALALLYCDHGSPFGGTPLLSCV